MEISQQEIREASLIVGVALISVFLSKLIDTLLKNPNPVWNPVFLLIGIIIAFLVSLYFIKKLPKITKN